MRTKEIQAMIKEGVFKPGTELSRDQVQRLTKRARPSAVFRRKTAKLQIVANLLLVEFQFNVNKQLHDKGLHLRSHDGYTQFHVLPRKKTGVVVDQYLSRAEGCRTSAVALAEGRLVAKRK